jgi:hypothetical protein
VHPRWHILVVLPCLLTVLCLALPARALADVSMFSAPSSCPGVPPGSVLTTAIDGTSAPAGWQASDITVTLTGTNVAGVEWMVDCGTTQSGPDLTGVVFNVSGAHTLSHRVRDAANEWTDWVDDPIQLDKSAPFNTTAVPPGWVQAAVNVSVTGSDSVSSVSSVSWNLDGAGPQAGPSGSSVPVSGDGVHTFDTRITDAAGNQSVVRSDTVRIDGTVPIDDTAPPVGWQYSPTSVVVTGHDGGSNVGHVEWKLDGVLSSGANGASVSIPEGSHFLETRIVDVAGNASGWTGFTVMVDLSGPQDTTTPPTTWQSAPFVDVIVKGTDANGAGIQRVDWELDGVPGTWPANNHPVHVAGDGDHILKTRVFDGMDDSGWTTHHVKLDTVTPTDITTAAAGWQRAPLDVAVSAVDAHSGVEHVAWQLDGSATQTSTGNPHTVNVAGDGVHSLLTRVYDVAGNASGWKSTTIAIDASAPHNTTPTTTAAWRANAYAVVLSGNDDVSGMAEMRYKIDGGATVAGASGFLTATVLGTGTHTLTTWGVDVAGNQSGQRTETINIDGVAPTDTTTAPGTVANQHPVAINGTDAHSGLVNVKWKLDGGPVQNGAPGSIVTISGGGPHTLETMVVDAVGNDSGWKSMTVTVDLSLTPDTTAPTDTTTSVTGWQPGPVTLTVKATDAGVGVNYVQWRLDGLLTAPSPSGSTVYISGEGDHELETRAVDFNGNTSAWRAQTISIDTVAPTDLTTLPTGWSGTRSFTLSGSDGTSGVAAIEYQLDGGATQTVANDGTITLPSDGSHTIRRRVLDAAGQASGWVLKTVRIDTVVPANTSAAAPTTWQTASGVSLPLTGTDALSGVDHAEWRIDGGSTSSGSPAVVSADGVQLLETRVVDVAGNASAWRGETVRIDRTAPENTTPVPAGGWQNTNYAGIVTGTDATSGVLNVEWKLDGGGVQTTPAVSISATGAHTLVSRVRDVAGNFSPWRTDSIGIDKVVPTLTAGCGSIEWRSSPATCTVASDGGLSGLGLLTAARGDGEPDAISGTSYTVDADGIWTITFRAVDGAGNEKLALASVKIDRTPPNAALSCVAGTGTSYSCTATGSDTVSGMAGLSWSLNGASATSLSSGGTFTVQKGTVVVTATDRAGNAAASAPVVLADRTAPVKPPPKTPTKKAPVTPRTATKVVLRTGKGSPMSRAVGELEIAALPTRTTVTLRPMALGKGRFQIVLKLTADRKSKTARRTFNTRTGYSPKLSVRLGGAAEVTAKLTVRRRSGRRWITHATASLKL